MRTTALFCLLLASVSTMAAPGDTHYIGPLQSEVRAGPSADSEVRFIIAIGRKVLEFGREGEWVNVGVDKSGGRDGWVRASDLSPTDPDGLRY